MSRLLVISVVLASLLATVHAAEYQITVKKAERKLELHRDGKVVKQYRIGLGFNPVGTKEQQGDGKTPEGRYFICNKNPKSRFYLSLGINYPNANDAKRGLKQGLITKQQHDLIVSAEQRKTIPPWNTRLGGEIFIHGRGANSDWTLGCIALDDAEMKELYDMIPVGTPVIISP